MRRNARVIYDCRACGAKKIFVEPVQDTDKSEKELLEFVTREAVCTNRSWKHGSPCPLYGKPQELKASHIEWE